MYIRSNILINKPKIWYQIITSGFGSAEAGSGDVGSAEVGSPAGLGSTFEIGSGVALSSSLNLADGSGSTFDNDKFQFRTFLMFSQSFKQKFSCFYNIT